MIDLLTIFPGDDVMKYGLLINRACRVGRGINACHQICNKTLNFSINNIAEK
jgi:hypothetical protein